MKRRVIAMAVLGLSVAGAGGLGGCASTRPPQELVDARAAYARAYVGPAARANTAELDEARRALDDAEREFAHDPPSEEARHLAYLAHRRVLLAETNARTVMAATERVKAEQTLAEIAARAKLHDDRGGQPKDQQKGRGGTTP